MNIDDVEIVEKRTPFQGYFGIDKYKLRHRKFEGGWGPVIDREIFEPGHAAACLPYDPVLDRVVLIEQFRAGPYAALDSQWFDGETQSPWLIECLTSAPLGHLSLFLNGGFGSSRFDVKPLVVDGSSGGF